MHPKPTGSKPISYSLPCHAMPCHARPCMLFAVGGAPPPPTPPERTPCRCALDGGATTHKHEHRAYGTVQPCMLFNYAVIRKSPWEIRTDTSSAQLHRCALHAVCPLGSPLLPYKHSFPSCMQFQHAVCSECAFVCFVLPW